MGLIHDILKIAAETALVTENVDVETALERAKICGKCEWMDHDEIRCKVCRCFLEVKWPAKTNRNLKRLRYEITHCPRGKWGPEDFAVANEYRKLNGEQPLPFPNQ